MKLNKYAKSVFIIGSILTVCAMTLCAVTFISAGKAGDYYLLMNYSEDFALLSRQCIGLSFLGGIILQIISPSVQE